MGGSKGMGDTSALEKQLNLKTKAIVDEKSRFLFDQHDMFQNKDRAIYYLERTIEARNRELASLRKEAEELEPKIRRAGYEATVDAGEANIATAQKEEQEAEADLAAAQLRLKSLKAQSQVYAAIMKRVDSGALSGPKITDELQKSLRGMEQENAAAHASVEDVKAAIQAINDDMLAIKTDFKCLDQYRVDAIFRVFTLKGKLKCLKHKLAAM